MFSSNYGQNLKYPHGKNTDKQLVCCQLRRNKSQQQNSCIWLKQGIGWQRELLALFFHTSRPFALSVSVVCVGDTAFGDCLISCSTPAQRSAVMDVLNILSSTKNAALRISCSPSPSPPPPPTVPALSPPPSSSRVWIGGAKASNQRRRKEGSLKSKKGNRGKRLREGGILFPRLCKWMWIQCIATNVNIDSMSHQIVSFTSKYFKRYSVHCRGKTVVWVHMAN